MTFKLKMTAAPNERTKKAMKLIERTRKRMEEDGGIEALEAENLHSCDYPRGDGTVCGRIGSISAIMSHMDLDHLGIVRFYCLGCNSEFGGIVYLLHHKTNGCSFSADKAVGYFYEIGIETFSQKTRNCYIRKAGKEQAQKFLDREKKKKSLGRGTSPCYIDQPVPLQSNDVAESVSDLQEFINETGNLTTSSRNQEMRDHVAATPAPMLQPLHHPPTAPSNAARLHPLPPQDFSVPPPRFGADYLNTGWTPTASQQPAAPNFTAHPHLANFPQVIPTGASFNANQHEQALFNQSGGQNGNTHIPQSQIYQGGPPVQQYQHHHQNGSARDDTMDLRRHQNAPVAMESGRSSTRSSDHYHRHESSSSHGSRRHDDHRQSSSYGREVDQPTMARSQPTNAPAEYTGQASSRNRSSSRDRVTSSSSASRAYVVEPAGRASRPVNRRPERGSGTTTLKVVRPTRSRSTGVSYHVHKRPSSIGRTPSRERTDEETRRFESVRSQGQIELKQNVAIHQGNNRLAALISDDPSEKARRVDEERRKKLTLEKVAKIKERGCVPGPSSRAQSRSRSPRGPAPGHTYSQHDYSGRRKFH